MRTEYRAVGIMCCWCVHAEKLKQGACETLPYDASSTRLTEEFDKTGKRLVTVVVPCEAFEKAK